MNGRHLGAMFSDPGLVAQIHAMAEYHPGEYDGPVTLLKSTGLANWDRWLFRPWKKVMRQTMHEIRMPGMHGSIFENENIDALATIIKGILTEQQGSKDANSA